MTRLKGANILTKNLCQEAAHTALYLKAKERKAFGNLSIKSHYLFTIFMTIYF